jgi:hypothetical protein
MCLQETVQRAAQPVEIIPGHRESHSGVERKTFAFPPESPFAFNPESCSSSPRNRFHVHPGIPFTLPESPVMVHQDYSGSWYRLVPSSFGSYANGTWSQAASMQPGYAPSYFSSAVLGDGRLVVIGGEGNGASSSGETNLGAVYDPVANAWTPLPAPGGWTEIGDAPNTVLPNGQFLLANIFTNQNARLDPVTLAWTNLGYRREPRSVALNAENLQIHPKGDHHISNHWRLARTAISPRAPAAATNIFVFHSQCRSVSRRPDGSALNPRRTGAELFLFHARKLR